MKKNKWLTLGLMLALSLGTTTKAYATVTAPNGKESPSVSYKEVEICPSDYYSSAQGLKGTELLNKIAQITNTNHRYYNNYGELRGGNCYSDADSSDPENKLIDFYTGWSFDNDWITSNDTGYNRDLVWEREHVWCKSLSGSLFTEVQNSDVGAGSDIHHLRPEIGSLNGSRSNKPFAELEDTTDNIFYYTDPNTNEKIETGCYATSSYFEPRKESKGDVARILMYLYMHYSNKVSVNTHSYAGNLVITNVVYTDSKTEQAAWDLLLDWNELDPVDEFEMNRNNYCASVTGTRNPFIDHPEYADIIWNTSYSGNGADGGVGGDIDSGNTGGSTDSGNEGGSSDTGDVETKESYTVTYTVESTSSVSTTGEYLPTSSVNFSSTYETKCQLTANNSATLTISGLEGYTVTNIDLSMKSNKSAGSGYITVTAGNTELASSGTKTFKEMYGSYSQEYVAINIDKVATFNNNYEIQNNEDFVIKINATVNSIYIQSYTITYVKAGQEEENTTSSQLKELINKYYNDGIYTKKSEIYLNQTAENELNQYFHAGLVNPNRTTYYKNNALLMGDLDGSFTNINSGYRTDGSNMNHYSWDEVNSKVVDDYSVKNTTVEDYYVTLNDFNQENYFASWNSYEYSVSGNNDLYLNDYLAFVAPCLLDSILTTNYLTVSKLTIAEKAHDTYGEYLEMKIIVDDDSVGTIINKNNVLAEARIYTGYNLFNENPENETPSETTSKVVFSECGYTNAQEVSNVTLDENVSITFNKGTNTTTPKYYTTGTAIRVYGGGYFVVESNKTISKIVLTFGSGDGSNEITTDVGTYSNGIFEGETNSVKFTLGGTSGHRRIASIEVTYK